MRAHSIRWLLRGAITLTAFTAWPAAADKWTVVHTPYVTVLTTESGKVARDWAVQFEQFHLGLAQTVTIDLARLQPVTVVLFRGEKSFRPYKLLQNGKPANIGGYFARNNGGNVIALALDFDEEETRRVIFHEATHWCLSTRKDDLPLWLEEGLAEVYSTFTVVDDKHFRIGDALAEHVRFLQQRHLMDFPALFAVGHESLDFNEDSHAGLFYAESWGLVHWLVFGEKSPGAKSIDGYLGQMATTKDPAATFATVFGGDYKTVQQQLEHYLAGGTYRRSTVAVPLNITTIGAAREDTPGEVEFALGSLLYAAHGPAEAEPLLRRAAELDPGNVHVWETLAFSALQRKDNAAAQESFDKAALAGSTNPLVWYNRAVLRTDVGGVTPGALVQMDTDDYNRAAADFRRALALDPRCKEAYEGLAGVVHGVEPAELGDVGLMRIGLNYFPKSDWIHVGVATATMRNGAPEAGEAMLRQLLANPDTLSAVPQKFARSVLEHESVIRCYEQANALYDKEKYPEALVVIDATLATDLTPQNRQELLRFRKRTDHVVRVGNAINLINSGHAAKGMAALRTILDEEPSLEVRREAERLLKSAEAMPPGR